MGAYHSDPWLSGILGRPAYAMDSAAPAEPLPAGPAFVTCKVAGSDSARIGPLCRQGFDLIETAATLKKPVERGDGSALARFATAADEAAVRAIAGQAFADDRFHRDPRIDKGQADRIKADWAGNFFAGKRGTHMVVADCDGQVAGFLQLILKNGVLIIDLVATAPQARRRGVGAAMIRFAEYAIPGADTYVVGTQLHNLASLALYQRLGFRLASTSHTLHYHGAP